MKFFSSRETLCRLVVAGMLVFHVGLLAYCASVHSPTVNEPGHLVAGISYWRFGRFDVYNVNPPLSRLVAALPVLASGCKTNWSEYYDGPGARPEMALGEAFVHANGERSIWLFTIARCACIPFSVIGGYVVFRWSRELYGATAGLLSLTLWCFCPNILAHGSLITPDMSATALGVAACYAFWHWLRRPTWWHTILCGAALGIAELSKTTLLLFYASWPVTWLIYHLFDWQSMGRRNWLRELSMLAACAILSIYVLNLGYGFEGTFTKLGKYNFVSNSLTGNQADDNASAGVGNRFEHSWIAAMPVPLPKNYVEGIDLQKKDFEHYGEELYLNGVWRDRGWWYYYLEALALKVPLGTWLLLLLAATRRLWRCKALSSAETLQIRPNAVPVSPAVTITGKGQSVGGRCCLLCRMTTWRDEFILLSPALVILAFVSSQTGLNDHMRYVLPIFPFFFIWIGRVTFAARQRSVQFVTSAAVTS